MNPAGPAAGSPAASSIDRGALDRSLIRGIAWTGAIRWAAQLLSWAGTIVVAHLLVPSQFGLVGVANVFIGLVERVSELGLGAAVIRRKIRDPELVGQINVLAIALGCSFAGVAFLGSWPIAAFLGKPAVQPVIAWLSLTFVVTAFRVIPRAMMSLDLRFRSVALLDGIEAITSTLVIMVLAFLGAGHWSIVAGLLTGTVASTLTAVGLARPPFRRPRPGPRLQQEVGYGLHIVGSRLAWYWYNQADFVVVGRFLTEAAMGFYSFAWQLASIPVQRISGLVNQVATPVFARVQDQRAELARYFMLLTEGLAFVTIPFSVGMVLTGPELVRVFLSDQWLPTVLPLQVLGFYGAVRTITNLFTNVLQAVGRAKEVFRNTLVAALLLPIGFVIGALNWGTTGVAAAWVIGYPLAILPQARLAFQVTGVRLGDFLRAIRPAVQATVVMSLIVLGVRFAVVDRWPAAAVLAAEVAAGVLSYGAAVYLLFGDQARQILQTLRSARGAPPLADETME